MLIKKQKTHLKFQDTFLTWKGRIKTHSERKKKTHSASNSLK